MRCNPFKRNPVDADQAVVRPAALARRAQSHTLMRSRLSFIRGRSRSERFGGTLFLLVSR
jgi:hypothetical protein